MVIDDGLLFGQITGWFRSNFSVCRTMWKRSRSFLTIARPLQTNVRKICAVNKICIVGSGPAGFYFAQNVLKKLPGAMVDMYEKLPVPYGLVRYGVAPDHPEVKNVIHTFEKTASNANFRFVGNVTLGQDVTLSDLQKAYHAVVMAIGCNEDRNLDIPGERLNNVVSARQFVGWYNGLPEDANVQVNLTGETVVVLGQGNVAMDVARVLLSPIDKLKLTDITEYSLQALSKSKVKTVYLVGRRGPLQAAFTIKEFREMTKLPNVQTVFQHEHFCGTEKIIPELPRARKRLSELLVKTSQEMQSGERVFYPTFLHKPTEIVGDSTSTRVAAVKFELNDVDHVKGVAKGTGKSKTIDCDLVLRSIGYKGTSPDPNIPFDSTKCVVDDQNGIYSAGWIHTGPSGVILSTMADAFDQSGRLVQDISSKKLNVDCAKPGYPLIKAILDSKGIVTVDFNGWKRIDQEEIKRGTSIGKPREKIVNLKEMLKFGGS